MSRKIQSKGLFRNYANHRLRMELRPSNRHKLPLDLAHKRHTKRRSEHIKFNHITNALE